MRLETNIAEADSAPVEVKPATGAVNVGMLRDSASAFTNISDSLNEIDRLIDQIAEFGERSVTASTRKMQNRLRRAEPSVTMIGQVKSGKTTLVNAMIGMPDLLPADVNPWTSVVTSIHLHKDRHPDSGKAVFRLFTENDWDALLTRGGRIGELAGRSGAEDEITRVAEQLAIMREKSRRRLGRKFEMMMGQEHKYGYFDKELIQRYVCLGDDFENDFDTSSQGRFADVTKSADLYLHRPEYPMDLCIRDTPGVNDTFMMREQITIRAIRESRTCVVVLSAHQAMSSVDLALVRVIANIPSRSVVIFVNRIDELADPARQVPEIRESIRKTLRDHRGPANAEIIFGSAYWARHALLGTMSEIDPSSLEAMIRWGETRDIDWPEGENGSDTDRIIWKLSGVPELTGALSARLKESIGREVADSVARSALNLANTLETSLNSMSRPHKDPKIVPLNRQALPAELDRIEARAMEKLGQTYTQLTGEFHKRLDHANSGFIDRATGALIAYLEKNGSMDSWVYDPTGLRILLRSAFQVFVRRARSGTQRVYEQVAEEIRGLYFRAFSVEESDFWLEAPALPSIAPPVSLGTTIALDLNGNWWTRWWQARRGYRAYAADFAELITAETQPIVNGLKEEYGETNRADAEAALREFISAQRTILSDLAQRDDGDGLDLSDLPVDSERRRKSAVLQQVKKELAGYVTTPSPEEN